MFPFKNLPAKMFHIQIISKPHKKSVQRQFPLNNFFCGYIFSFLNLLVWVNNKNSGSNVCLSGWGRKKNIFLGVSQWLWFHTTCQVSVY